MEAEERKRPEDKTGYRRQESGFSGQLLLSTVNWKLNFNKKIKDIDKTGLFIDNFLCFPGFLAVLGNFRLIWRKKKGSPSARPHFRTLSLYYMC